ncbi:hypothetical protein [Actinomadura sp. WMMA1423]|uniref:hypothetical protein n=1 Tax=Actinomadura sp. WMMA1423 TaxID=2591108 RepID=UPI001146B7A0|nr:hypothetical protein [Actinomadura sp. WMMA1423]
MRAPAIQVGALIELQVDRHGFVDETAANRACAAVDADGGLATVLIHGVLRSADASASAARQVGAALATAARIDVLGNGPAVVAWAALVQGFAAEERSFRATGRLTG